ncbi:response regulator transcription factor [Christensenellaceae bacterium OttesenSCG-928-M15]|nr:response regulator transcription factor [Christensenellaceae bacterium OttesenSCG-928-M15]
MIYYVEDDDNIRELVLYTLGQTGYGARGFSNAKAFWQAVDERLPVLVLLDIMLPDEDGISILRQLREQRNTHSIPVIMLTAKGTEYDKVLGLDFGADDYIAKPFGMMELLSRVRALLRRVRPQAQGDIYEVGALMLNANKHLVTCNGLPLKLSLKEFLLLQYLLENRGRVFTREHLLEAVWGYEYAGGTRTVDVHVQTLRQKLGACAELIETVRGVGYRAKE